LNKQVEKYMGREIIIEIFDNSDHSGGHEHSGGHGQQLRLAIDNRDIHIMPLSSGYYSSHYLPYEKFPSPLLLAKALIDRVPLFSEKQV
jgi:hypothetical protein